MVIIYRIGNYVTVFLEHTGNVTLKIMYLLRLVFRGRIRWRLVFEQMVSLGINSIPIVFVTAFFVGMAFTIQIVREFLRFGAAQMIGGIIGMAFWRELGPLMTGVVVAGRIGAAIAAELGTMKVTEQVEALEALSQDSMEYLVLPRCVALVLMLPLLVGFADVIGFMAGFLIATISNVNPSAYFSSAQNMLDVMDILGGGIKAMFFGLSIGFIASFKGLSARSGARGVGRVTRRSVVACLVSVFVLNYFFSLVIY